MYGSAKRKYWVGGMDEVWNQKYEQGPIRDPAVDSILSIYARMATQEHAGRPGRIAKLVSDLEIQSQTISGRMGDLGAPANLRFNLAQVAQCTPNSRENSPYDPAWGPRASGIFWKPLAWGV